MNLKQHLFCGLVASGLLMAGPPVRALVEVATAGPTEQAAPYLAEIQAESAQAQPRVPETPEPPSVEQVLAGWLPVTTPELSPGPLEASALPVETRNALPAMSVPLFVVGADEQSLRWLAAWAPELKRLGAAGLAVEVPDMAAWERLKAVAAGLDLVPVSGSSLAQEMGLRHYPVLVTREGMRH